MIKSIKPGVLAGMDEITIENKLEEHFGCPVAYSGGVLKIYCIDQYDEVSSEDKPFALLCKHLHKLHRVGEACIACDKTGPHVKLVFNPIAMDVISGERARREAKRIKNKQGEMI